MSNSCILLQQKRFYYIHLLMRGLCEGYHITDSVFANLPQTVSRQPQEGGTGARSAWWPEVGGRTITVSGARGLRTRAGVSDFRMAEMLLEIVPENHAPWLMPVFTVEFGPDPSDMLS
jgi:hypothetical protein